MTTTMNVESGPMPDRAYLKHSCGSAAEVTYYAGGVAIATATIQAHERADGVGRLAAAAPDLLAALKAIIDYAHSEEEELERLARQDPEVGDEHAKCQGALRVAFAAIRKAEGGAA